MKKYLLGLFAVVLAVGFSAFTKSQPVAKKFAAIYLEYTGAIGIDEKDVTLYTPAVGSLATCANNQNRLCWIAVTDTDNSGVIEQAELDAFFLVRDADHDDVLSDQGEIPNVLEKRAI